MSAKVVSLGFLALLAIGLYVSVLIVHPVKANGTIYIRADGSIDPPDAPIATIDNITYTLTGNIASDADGIVVERDNIVIDGARYVVQGTGSEHGMELSGRTNVTVQNVRITGFEIGIYAGFNVPLYGPSSGTKIRGNDITNNSNGIFVGADAEYSDLISGNYTIDANNITDNGYGIYVGYSVDSRVCGNSIANNNVGIHVYRCLGNNTLSGNNVRANNGTGILFFYSSDNIVCGNNITNNGESVYLYGSLNSTVCYNNMTANNKYGIHVNGSSNSTVCGNNIANNEDGIYLDGYANNGTIYENNITANSNYGIRLDFSSYNAIYNNNFLDNGKQAYVYTPGYSNFWDNGYPFGGNYWSDYDGTDVDNDGFGDTPYVIDANNVDHYPLVNPHNPLTTEMLFDFRYANLTVGQELTVTIKVTDVLALGAWQVLLKYNGTILNCTGVRIPDNNVFAGLENQTIVLDPWFGTDIYDGQQFVGYGSSLLFDNVSATSGILCKMNFTALSAGTTPLSIVTRNNPAYESPSQFFYSLLAVYDESSEDWVDVPFNDRSGVVNVGWAKVDINGDGKVDMKDIGISAKAFGTVPGDTLWNPLADITGSEPLVADGKVDMRDIGLVARHFGKHYP